MVIGMSSGSKTLNSSTGESLQIVHIGATAKETIEENVAKLRTSVAWYIESWRCLFCLKAGIVTDAVRIAAVHARGGGIKNRCGRD